MQVVTKAATPEEKKRLFNHVLEVVKKESAPFENLEDFSEKEFLDNLEKNSFHFQKHVIIIGNSTKTIFTFIELRAEKLDEVELVYESGKETIKETGKTDNVIMFIQYAYQYKNGNFTDIREDFIFVDEEEEKQESPVDLILNKHHELQPQQFTKWLITNSEKLKQMENNINDQKK